jgi:hypothetical protein
MGCRNSDSPFLLEIESKGHGMFRLAKKDSPGDLYSIDIPITDELIDEYKGKLENDEVDQEKSYLVSYSEGTFTVLFSNVPERYLISYEDYKQKGYLDVLRLRFNLRKRIFIFDSMLTQAI